MVDLVRNPCGRMLFLLMSTPLLQPKVKAVVS